MKKNLTGLLILLKTTCKHCEFGPVDKIIQSSLYELALKHR